MRLWLQYLQLEYAGLERLVFEAYVMKFMSFHTEVIGEFCKVLTCQVVSEVSIPMLSLL